MQMSHQPAQWLAVMLLVVFTTSQCQQDESRRAVAEHQLMHNRGENIQSLRRLIWLSSAIEGLHTARTRSAPDNPAKVMTRSLNPALVSAAGGPAGGPQSGQVQGLLKDFFHSYLSHCQS